MHPKICQASDRSNVKVVKEKPPRVPYKSKDDQVSLTRDEKALRRLLETNAQPDVQRSSPKKMWKINIRPVT
jgi:hypothetical protein